MNTKYELTLLDEYRVRFNNPYDSTDLAYYYYLTEEEMEYVDQWLHQNELGSRRTYSSFQLKGPKELDIFLLKWSK